MKVFISWSGDQSNRLAMCLADWLPNVIQRARTFVSTGISKGSRWSTVIASELSDTDFGILCVTADNIDAPWLLFEAGAISKSLAHGKVAPILMGIAKDALSGSPLTQFQLSELAREDMSNLVKSLNEADGDRLDDRRLQDAFDAFWPKFEAAMKASGLSTALPTVASSAQTSSNTTGEKTSVVDTEPETLETRILIADVATIDAVVMEIKKSREFEAESDFWTALIADRRHDMGMPDDTETVKTLHEASPASFWPRYFLAHQALVAGDLKAASEQTRALPPPVDARSKARLEALQRDLAALLPDLEDGLQYVKSMLASAASEASKANTIESFAIKHATDGPDTASCMLREFALRLNPSDQNVRFNLAHKLAERRYSSTVAFEQYERVRASSSALGPNATHNMGVIASSRGIPALMYKLYEEAKGKGIALSSINLAESIISSGNLIEAREILSSVKDTSAYSQSYDAAKQRLSNAERKLAEDEKSLVSAAKHTHSEFSRMSDICVRSWLEDHAIEAGTYSIENKGLKISVHAQNVVSASLTRSGKIEEGTMQSNGLCYEGLLAQKGTKAGALSRSLLLTPLNADGVELLALMWGGPLPNEPAELITLVREEPAQQEPQS